VSPPRPRPSVDYPVAVGLGWKICFAEVLFGKFSVLIIAFTTALLNLAMRLRRIILVGQPGLRVLARVQLE
jgi:hypothetical protein